MTAKGFLIYGANGYTGALLSRLAHARGHAPVLAGRSEEKVAPLARELGLPARTFPLDLGTESLRRHLDGIGLVVHCAGPFSATSRPMLDACLAAGAHYLDITGEVEVLDAVLARDAEAKRRGVVALGGAGFDVVPSDCLAAMLKERLPSATALELAFAPGGRSSPGTLKSSLEALPRGGLVRRGGRLQRVPLAYAVRDVPFATGTLRAMSIPWGDLATAWVSTGIPDITVYMALPPGAIAAARFAGPAAALLSIGPVQRFLQSYVERAVQGPDAAARAAVRVQLWGRATDGAGGAAEATMEVPEGYTFTAEAALAIALRVRDGGVAPGAWTPSRALGSGFVLSLPGCSMRWC